MKPYIRKRGKEWVCGSYKETLEYLIDKSIDFGSLDNTKVQAIGQGSSPMAAYQDWVKNYVQVNTLIAVTKARNPIECYDLDAKTATGHFLRHLAQKAGVLFGDYDTDEQVRNALIGEKK